MAKKSIFIADPQGFYEKEVDYTFFPGFAPSQKQKCVRSLHDSIRASLPETRVLEVSTKSIDPLGVKLSAFNLTLNGRSVESIFQSSKVFEDGTQFEFLLNQPPRDARRYVKENGKGPLHCFHYDGKDYPLAPKSAFYDFIYITALSQNEECAKALQNYNVFTDIEFNSAKSINCQARSCAIFVSLVMAGKLDEMLSSFESFIGLYSLADL